MLRRQNHRACHILRGHILGFARPNRSEGSVKNHWFTRFLFLCLTMYWFSLRYVHLCMAKYVYFADDTGTFDSAHVPSQMTPEHSLPLMYPCLCADVITATAYNKSVVMSNASAAISLLNHDVSRACSKSEDNPRYHDAESCQN